MIQVYKPSNTDFDANGDMTLTPTIAYTNSILNGAWTAALTHPIDADGRWKYLEEDAVIKMPSFNGDQLYRIRKIYTADSGIICTMEPVFYDTIDNTFLTDVRPTEKTGQEALDIMLGGSIKYSAESDIETVSTAYYQYKNFMEALNGDIDQSFINRWGGEILFDNFKVIVNSQIGSDNGAEIRYGKNVTYDGLTEEIDTRDVITVIYPKAYNGYTLSGNGYVESENISSYPVRRIRTITFEDVKMAEDATEDDEANGVIICSTQDELDAALTQKCEEQFKAGVDKPKVTITADMVIIQNTELYNDLSFLEEISLGDIVYCRHSKLGITTDSRVIELKYDSIRKKVSKAVIGDFREDYFTWLGKIWKGYSGTTVKKTTSSGNTGTTTTTYTWEKYEAVESAGYVITYETGVEITDTQTTKRVLYKTISVDNATGEIVLSDALKESGSYGSEIVSNYETYPYIYIDGAAYKITYYASKGTYQGYGGTTELATAKAQFSGVFTQGDYIGTATSSSPDAYPDNGYQDGYWYVKK